MTLNCGHDDKASEIRLCSHLVGQAEVAFWRVLRGDAMRYDCCCELCQQAMERGEPLDFVEVCAACAQKIDSEKWDFRGWRGAPSVEEFPVPFNDTLQTVTFPDEMRAAQALYPLDSGRVLAFYESQIGIFEGETFTPLVSVQMPEDTTRERNNHGPTPHFHLSPSGRYAALVNDYGRYGAVFDLENARQTMNLERGEHCPETVLFSLAFFACEGRDLVVHATNWNRLEISDPQNGELLTPRAATHYRDKNPHYLDYFHGALHIAPDGEWIADDGWVWSPAGIVCVWNLKNWLYTNVYESEKGASRRDLNYGWYLWNRPICWLDAHRIAIEGIGDEEGMTIGGATVFDARSGEQLAQFAGPSGEFWSDGTRLFSVENDGLHLWDVESGARTGILRDFRPNFQIGTALAQLEGNTMTIWRCG